LNRCSRTWGLSTASRTYTKMSSRRIQWPEPETLTDVGPSLGKFDQDLQLPMCIYHGTTILISLSPMNWAKAGRKTDWVLFGKAQVVFLLSMDLQGTRQSGNTVIKICSRTASRWWFESTRLFATRLTRLVPVCGSSGCFDIKYTKEGPVVRKR